MISETATKSVCPRASLRSARRVSDPPSPGHCAEHSPSARPRNPSLKSQAPRLKPPRRAASSRLIARNPATVSVHHLPALLFPVEYAMRRANCRHAGRIGPAAQRCVGEVIARPWAQKVTHGAPGQFADHLPDVPHHGSLAEPQNFSARDRRSFGMAAQTARRRIGRGFIPMREEGGMCRCVTSIRTLV